MDHNPYSAPQYDSTLGIARQAKPRLWNPAAAVGWSLLLSPVFGAILHMINWRALGRPDKARQSLIWAVMIVVLFVAGTAWGGAAPAGSVGDTVSNFVGIALFAGWFVASALEQIRHVKMLGDYERRGWVKPVSLTIIGGIALIVVFLVVALGGRRS